MRARQALRALIPTSLRRRVRARFLTGPPGVGRVRFGSLRRLTPVSRVFGYDRGTPVDRYYIDEFLARHSGANQYGAGDIRGEVLEVGDTMYTEKFGGWSKAPNARSSGKVRKLDVLHANRENPEATLVGDLVSGEGVPAEAYDCVICTQTLHVIYDVHAAVRTLHRMLKPGGVVLATVAGISQACRPDRDLWGDYWRFTTLSARRVFEEVFSAELVAVEGYGNVLSATAFLHGLAAEELRREELDSRDPDYELLIAVRARK